MSFTTRLIACVIGGVLGLLPAGCGGEDGSATASDRSVTSSSASPTVGSRRLGAGADVPTSSEVAAHSESGASPGVAPTGRPRSSAAPKPTTTAAPDVSNNPARVAPPPLAMSPGGRPDESSAPAGPAGPGGATAVADRTRLEQALDDGDLCAVYSALGQLEISGRSVREFRAGMVIVLDAVRRADAFVPPELADSWNVLVVDTERVVEVLGEPDASVSSAAAVFQDQAYRDAMDRTDAWMDANCGR